MPYARVWSSIADSRSATATPMWSMRPNTAASVPSPHVRLALVVNRASGRGVVPAVPGAEVVDFGQPIPEVDRIIVAGGDGSIGPVAELAGRRGVPLGVIPTGTANDFARANGIPLDLEAATRLAVEGDTVRALELGHLATGRAFVNVASAGLA